MGVGVGVGFGFSPLHAVKKITKALQATKNLLIFTIVSFCY
jgi:hypothetical protein